jgi:multisubunit Na+/H+ antiporter MnhG subunit
MSTGGGFAIETCVILAPVVAHLIGMEAELKGIPLQSR